MLHSTNEWEQALRAARSSGGRVGVIKEARGLSFRNEDDPMLWKRLLELSRKWFVPSEVIAQAAFRVLLKEIIRIGPSAFIGRIDEEFLERFTAFLRTHQSIFDYGHRVEEEALEDILPDWIYVTTQKGFKEEITGDFQVEAVHILITMRKTMSLWHLPLGDRAIAEIKKSIGERGVDIELVAGDDEAACYTLLLERRKAVERINKKVKLQADIRKAEDALREGDRGVEEMRKRLGTMKQELEELSS